MSGAAAASQAPRATTAVPVLDAQAAELKAERLWGMADAQKPVSMERKNGMPEVSQFPGPFNQPSLGSRVYFRRYLFTNVITVLQYLVSACLAACLAVCLSFSCLHVPRRNVDKTALEETLPISI